MNNNVFCYLFGLALVTCSSVAGAISNDLTVLDKSKTFTTSGFDTSVMKKDGFKQSEFNFNYGEPLKIVFYKASFLFSEFLPKFLSRISSLLKLSWL